MDQQQQRLMTFLLVALVVIWIQFKLYPPPKRPTTPVAPPGPATENVVGDGEQPGTEISQAPPEAATPVDSKPEEMVVVDSDSYRISFSTRGAVPHSWLIVDPEFIVTNGDDSPATSSLEMITPLPDSRNREYPFELIFQEGYAQNELDEINNAIYDYEISEGEDGELVARFTSPPIDEKLRIVKTYRIPKSGFLGSFSVAVENLTDQRIDFDEDGHGPGVMWAAGLGNDGKSMRSYSARTAAVWLGAEKPFFEYENKMQVNEVYRFDSRVKWCGLSNRYFFAALIPGEENAAIRVTAKSINAPPGSSKKGTAKQGVELYQKTLILLASETKVYEYQFYVGPKTNRLLQAAGSDLELDQVLFYQSFRWFRRVCLWLMGILIWFHGFLPDYGYAIIATTILVKLVMQPFVHFSMKSNARFMKVQQKLKPELDELMKKHKDEPQKRNEEMWKLYKKHNTNPLGMMKGCFWILLQSPIFFAIFRLLDASIELHGASFLWIDDLSIPDQLMALPGWFPLIDYVNLLPILMTITQYLSTKLTTSTPSDPSQKMMMQLMPVFFLFIMYKMSAGLVLYWLISNVWTIGSQYFINKSLKKEDGPGKVPRPATGMAAAGGPTPAEAAESPPRKPRKKRKR